MARTPQDVERKHRLKLIETTAEDVEELKEDIVVDSTLSISSTHPVENKAITQALANKVNRESGKVLSSNDFTDGYRNLIDTVSNISHTHINKSVLDNITQADINKWNESGSESASGIYQEYHTDYSGYVWFNDGFLVQWGRASVTPSAINTDTTARITYTYSYDNIPDRKTEVSSATPTVAKVTSGGGTTVALSKQGMNIYVNSSTTRAVTVDWLATGFKGI